MNEDGEIWKDVTAKHQREEGSERYLRKISDNFYISVSYRLTGFGYHEWETAIVSIYDDKDPRKFKRGTWDDRKIEIVRGDRREELGTLNEQEVIEWYKEHGGEKNSFETILDFIKN